MIGGYAMVDCKGLNLLGGSTPQTIAGIFSQCEKAMQSGKPIIAVNCVYGTGVKSSPIAVMGIKESGYYIFTSSILQINVESNDHVTVSSLIA